MPGPDGDGAPEGDELTIGEGDAPMLAEAAGEVQAVSQASTAAVGKAIRAPGILAPSYQRPRRAVSAALIGFGLACADRMTQLGPASATGELSGDGRILGSMTTSQPVEFEIAPPVLEYAVSVRLRNLTGRWVAVAECLGGRHIGLGATASVAMASAFAPLGTRTAAILMADPALFGASLRVSAA